MNRFRSALLLCVVLVLGLTVVGCSQKNVAAKVNGDVITIEELDQQVEQLKKQYPQMFEGTEGEARLLDFKQRLLDNLISQKLVEQAAEEKKIEITDSEIDKQVATLKTSFGDDAQFESALKSAGMTVDGLKDQLRDQLLTQKLIDSISTETSPTAAEIKDYYAKNKAQFAQAAAKRASHILFKPEDKKTAEKVLAQLEEGGNFEALAKQYSQDEATKAKGGDLGWPTTPYTAEFEKALAKLDKDETSGLVKTPFGWHIIRVTDERKASQKTLTEATEQIAQLLAQQSKADSYSKYLDGLREKAKIEILLPELKATVGATESTSTK